MARKTRNSTRSAKAVEPAASDSAATPAATTTTATTGLPEPGTVDGAGVAGCCSPKTKIVVSPQDKAVRQRALKLLQTSQELPVLYACLKRIREIGVQNPETEEEDDSDLTEHDEKILHQAAVAVPYLMYQKTYEQFMVPRTMGGLALSDAKAKSLAQDLFLVLKPATAACGSLLSSPAVADQQELVQRIHKKARPEQQILLKRLDARKILTFLKLVGQEARSQVEQIYDQLNHDLPDDDDDNDDNNNKEEEEEEEGKKIGG